MVGTKSNWIYPHVSSRYTVLWFAAVARPQYNSTEGNADSQGNKEGLTMAMTVKKIVLWRKEVDNRPGILANALAPVAHAGTDIHVVMAYRFPGQQSKAAIEFYPVTGKRSLDRKSVV